jgi:hypothetical protein
MRTSTNRVVRKEHDQESRQLRALDEDATNLLDKADTS